MVDSADGDILIKEQKPEAEDQSSSSDSDIDKYTSSTSSSLHATNKKHLFGRHKPLHRVLGGGKPANIILWRNKQMSGGILAGATVIWFLFEGIGYHLLTLLCHSISLSLAAFFLWSNLASFFNMSPPEFPEITMPEELFVKVALLLRNEINQASLTFREVASGKDLKQFLLVTFVLWIISVIGSWFSFLTLLYLVLVMVLTLPMLYDKHEDVVDAYAAKALVEIKKQYAVLDEKFLHKIPIPGLHHKQH